MIIRSTGYNIYTTDALAHLSAFLKKRSYSSFIILCDENTMSECLAILLTRVPALAGAEVIETESGEHNKALEVCAGVWQTMTEMKAGRDALLLNLGGGVICDMGAFCAAVYKRGIDFVHIPTTLLAMTDASIGGKTGVDLAHNKNVLGSFTQPAGVFIDNGFLNTLSQRHYYNGLAEVFKTALVSDASLFDYLDKKGGNADIQRIINKCATLKNSIVKTDPYDKGVRKGLNFGHSLGHALESFALSQDLDLLHGEAVVAGMIMESHIALQKKLLAETHLVRIVSLLLGHYGKLEFDPDFDALLPFLENDKKNRKNELRFALITRPGKSKWDVTVKKTEIRKAINFYQSLQYAEN